MTGHLATGRDLRVSAPGILNLPFDIAHVNGHPTIQRIVKQISGDYVSLVIHSTHTFASENANVYGSTRCFAAPLSP